MLLELHRDAQTLEDVFRSLTIGDERRNRRLTPAVDEAEDTDDDTSDDDDDGAVRKSSRAALRPGGALAISGRRRPVPPIRRATAPTPAPRH